MRVVSPIGNYVAVNAPVVDVLDAERSQVVQVSHGREIVTSPVFRNEAGQYPLFRVPQLQSTHVFFSEAVKAIIKAHGLTGLVL